MNGWLLRYVSIIVSVCAIAATCVSLFTSYWIEVEVPQISVHFHRGLMKWVCVSEKKFSNSCIAKFSAYPGWLKSVFICMCVALGCQILQFFVSILLIKLKKFEMYTSIFSTILAFTSLALISVSIGLFAGKANDLYFEQHIIKNTIVWTQFGWSYWISIFSLLLSFIVTVIEGVLVFITVKGIKFQLPYPPEAMTTWKMTM